MSLRYKGGVISATPPTTSTTSASGNWTLEQQFQAQGAGTWPFGGPFNYIEDVFSTYLYTGTGGTQSIPSGIDYTKGFLYWAKTRDSGASGNNHYLVDSERGANSILISNTTGAALAPGNQWTALTTTSITVQDFLNLNGRSEVGWTFRKQPKFFDVVTYTGTGSLRTVSHNLGSVPGCIIIKNLSDTDGWLVYHRSIGATKTLSLNTTGAAVTDGNDYFNNTEPTSTQFTVNIGGKGNASGNNYVAYLFAHNAGGFGSSNADNVISCGSFSGAQTINLGYEPQWVLVKGSDTATNWQIEDNMRGLTSDGTGSKQLYPNLSNAEANASDIKLNATGFETTSAWAGITGIYIAIRRGPMKTPTSGTSVFNPNAYTATGVGNRNFTDVGFSPDWSIFFDRSNSVGNSGKNITRLLGSGNALNTTDTSALQTGFDSYFLSGYNNNGYTFGSSTGGNGQLNGANGDTKVFWNFGRAPGFFDVVCYTGDGTTNRNLNHNLTVAPELLICKRRSGVLNWHVLLPSGNVRLFLNSTSASPTYSGAWSGTTPTATTFSLGGDADLNASGSTYVTYLFATVAGVSKVGSYTGNGTTQTINCGFTSGARFVLIKRTDSTGDWWVYDSARGITSGNDPYLFLNSAAAEVTGTNYVDTDTTGFKVTAAAPAGLNASGGTYIFLAIA